MKKVRIGVIGCGGIANGKHLPAHKHNPDSEMVAFCDIIVERAEKAAKEYGIPGAKVYKDYKELLKDKTIDAVLVLTPNISHSFISVDAMKAGKHVMCEKPMAINSKEAKKMLDAAKKYKRILTIGYQSRYTPQAIFLKKECEKGTFGDIYYAKAQAIRRRAVPTWGVFLDEKQQGGGPLIDIGVQALDLTLYLMGNPKPVTTSGMAVAKIGNTPGHVGLLGSWDHTKFTVEDYASGFVRFEDGRSLILESSFAANIEPTEIVRSNLLGTKAGAELDDKLRIFGERCGALTNGEVFGYPEVNHFKEEFIAFYKSIEEDTPVPVPADQAINCLRILEGIYRSAEAGREIKLNEF